MRLRGSRGTADLVKMGLSNRGLTHPLNVAELQLEDGSWEIQYKGQGAPVWELGGEFTYFNSVALKSWHDILATANTPFDLIELSGNVERTIARVWIKGSPRLDELELINGQGRAYKWKLQLIREFKQPAQPNRLFLPNQPDSLAIPAGAPF